MEYVRECEESVDLLSGSVDSSWAAGKGRTNSSAGTGGIEPLMAITGLPDFDLVLCDGALIQFFAPPASSPYKKPSFVPCERDRVGCDDCYHVRWKVRCSADKSKIPRVTKVQLGYFNQCCSENRRSQ